MQQRRFRPGDVLDDYCPRERRITDHAIVAMIDDHIKQTRCVVCDAEHEYKEGKVPPQRRKKPQAALFTQVLDGLQGPQAARLAQPDVELELPPLPDLSPRRCRPCPSRRTWRRVRTTPATIGQRATANAQSPMQNPGGGRRRCRRRRSRDE